ncbi:hypothetical protein QFW80_00035 [Luteimonas sp. M1R5S18]|uniref:Integron gene cassette protein n=1 Tax=Luteimonas rhizosphaericola TaxID=3042024 RepID=A0ABT6JEB5_9GAMM|nr:hypothetical protein [Luteimonas rhizosphaericola]MDH5828912.1 hypothetical protein [Luteimonas rhizosphaericola]
MIEESRHPINPWILGGGLALMLAGFGLYKLFSPSPHGYLELLIAMPVFCLGLAFTGLSFFTGHPGRFRPLRIAVGVILVLAAASPVLSLVWLLIR